MPHFPQDDLNNKFSAFRADEAVRYEEDLVHRLLTRFSLQRVKHDLLQASIASTGMNRLTLDGFCVHFSDFPYYLGARIIRKVSERVTPSRLFKAFGTTELVKQYGDLLDAAEFEAQARSIGMVFPWPNLPPGLIMHNETFDTSTPGVRLYCSAGADSMTIEPYQLWLANLNWRPSKG